jgi:hypothetical protein
MDPLFFLLEFHSFYEENQNKKEKGEFFSFHKKIIL